MFPHHSFLLLYIGGYINRFVKHYIILLYRPCSPVLYNDFFFNSICDSDMAVKVNCEQGISNCEIAKLRFNR